MKAKFLVLAVAVGALAAGPAFARGAPAGAGGPPPGVTLGPPASHGPSNPTALANAADVLGSLNAAHASATAFEHANANSAVGQLATYESSMKSALADCSTKGQAACDAEITAAQSQLATATNKTLTPAAIAKINSLLGISGTGS